MKSFLPGLNRFSWKSIVFPLAILGLFAIYRVLTKSKRLDKTLAKAAAFTNQSAPRMIDSLTRFDSVVALPQNRMTYYYTLVQSEKLYADTVALKTQARNMIGAYMEKDERARLFREERTWLIYVCRDRYGDELFRIDFKPEDYPH